MIKKKRFQWKKNHRKLERVIFHNKGNSIGD